MNNISILDILQKKISINSKVKVCGWVRSRRDSKIGISFLDVYDGSCLQSLQIIVDKKIINYKKDILHITSGCSIIITGIVTQSVKNNLIFEIKANTVEILGWVENPDSYPISPKKHTLEYLRTVAHLRPRTNIIGAISRVRHILSKIIHNFLDKQGFFWVPTPLITSSNSEGIGEMFNVSTLDLVNKSYILKNVINYKKDFFGKKSFLTVSGQLNCEAYACALSKVYTFGPTFRAEHSNTSKHLAEFWMVELEIAFVDLKNIILLAKSLLKYVFKNILDQCMEEMEFFVKYTNKKIINILENFIQNDFIEIEYCEVINILQKDAHKFKNKLLNWGMDLSAEHEHYLTEQYFKNIVIIKNYPKNIKAFYMRKNIDNKTVAAMDILTPFVGEIIGGSQREERLDKLDESLKEKTLNKCNYWWYRDLRRYGTVPHSGFGLGFERLILCITGMKNIRDVVPFPRSTNNINF